jgi:hypothetical protein
LDTILGLPIAAVCGLRSTEDSIEHNLRKTAGTGGFFFDHGHGKSRKKKSL